MADMPDDSSDPIPARSSPAPVRARAAPGPSDRVLRGAFVVVPLIAAEASSDARMASAAACAADLAGAWGGLSSVVGAAATGGSEV